MTSWIERSVAWVFATVEMIRFNRQHRHKGLLTTTEKPVLSILDSWVAMKRSVRTKSPEGDGDEVRTEGMQYPLLQNTKVVYFG